MGPVEENFMTAMLNSHDPENKDNSFDKLIKVWYYAITTLSTIGYGDYTPVSTSERLIASAILMFGVAVFSFIMGQFIEILINYKSLWKVGHHKDLSQWIALLQRFNNGNPLNKELITKIEDFFDYFWDNNRLSALSGETDLRFMDELPKTVQCEIFVDYLFNDFLYNYNDYFTPENERTDRDVVLKQNFQAHALQVTNLVLVNLRIDPKTAKKRDFLVEFVKRLEPRFYNAADGEMI